jgi:cell division protein FtsQ
VLLRKNNRFRRATGRMHIFSIIGNSALFAFFIAITMGITAYIYMNPIKIILPIKHVVFTGNRHLTDDELRELTGIGVQESLVTISNKEVSQRLLKSPWVLSVSIRKGFPDTLSLAIEEAVPFALLDMNGRLFLIDENGKLLEEMKDGSIPFLPVITGDPFHEKKGFSDALKLAKLMNDRRFSLERDYIEIILSKPHELTITIDGTVVIVGSGMYKEKLERLLELENHIKNGDILVDYIDLRFADKAIVKPIKEEVIN